MFGYVRPRKDQMRLCDYDRYRAAYCGLCRSLGKQYGFIYRLFVNYDMTFLYFLHAGTQAEEKKKRCYCPANVFCKKPCYLSDQIYSNIAAMDIILCHYQICDAIKDKGFWKGIIYRFLRFLTKSGYRKAAKLRPDFDQLVFQQLDRLANLEASECESIDQAADCFSLILKGCTVKCNVPDIQRPMEQILYHVGRFIYLADALDDLKDDCLQNQYNPLRNRFIVKDGVLNQSDLDQLCQSMQHSISIAGSALELMPLKFGKEILENIIYLGLPAVLSAVIDGKFHAGAKI